MEAIPEPRSSSTDSPSLLYAVVVNWNQPADTIECVKSLLVQQPTTPEIIIVDNGSTDESVTILRQHFPQIELIASPTNRMFGGGYNLGISRALEHGAQAVFIINNDAFLDPAGLDILRRYASPDTGLVAPVIYYADQPGRIWSVGGRIHHWTLEKSDDYQNTINHGDWPEIIERDFVTGCGMLLTRRVLESVGFFDEAFTHYYEDMDLCRRVRLAGYRIRVIPQAKMWHKVALSSGGSDSPEERYWMARTSVYYFLKYGRGWRMLVIAPYRLGSAVKTSLRLLTHRRADSLRAYWRGLRDGLSKH